MTLIEIFLGLIFLHCLADFPLQGEFLAKQKGKDSYVMSVHCIIYSGIIYGFLLYLGVADPIYFIGLFVTHYLMDSWKCDEVKGLDEVKDFKTIRNWFYIDQLIHYFILVCIFIGVVL